MFPRRFRAIVVTAGLWAIAWAITSGLYVIAFQLLRGVSLAVLVESLLVSAIIWGTWGAFNGVAFAVLLASAEQNRMLENLSRGRVAVWGALGGALMPTLTYALTLLLPGLTVAGFVTLQFASGTVFPTVLISAIVGAAVAAGELSLARRLPGPQAARALPAQRST